MIFRLFILWGDIKADGLAMMLFRLFIYWENQGRWVGNDDIQVIYLWGAIKADGLATMIFRLIIHWEILRQMSWQQCYSGHLFIGSYQGR